MLTYRRSLVSALLVALAACAAVAIFLAREVAERDPLRADTALLEAIHAHTSPLLAQAAAVASYLGGPGVVVVAVVMVVLVLRSGERRLAMILAIGMALSELLNIVLKEIFDRVRPELWLHAAVSGESFPSGHAMASTVIYGLAAWLAARAHPRYAALFGTLAALLIAAIAFSRLVLGVHWPSDVIGGVAIGFLCLNAIIAVATRRFDSLVSAPNQNGARKR
jgi:membrane-associated phospholipid phosphatase